MLVPSEGKIELTTSEHGDLTTNVEAKGEGAANKMVGLVGEAPS